MVFSALIKLLADARYTKSVANLVPIALFLSLALCNTIFSGVVDICKYPHHQLITNEAANSSPAPTE